VCISTNQINVVLLADGVTTLVRCLWADDKVPVLMSMTCVSRSNQVKKGTLCKGLSLHCLIIKWRLWNASVKSIFSHRGGCVCVIFCMFYLKKYIWCVLSLFCITESALKFVGVCGGAFGWGTALQAGKSVSIPDGVGIFYWHNPSGRTVALGSTQPLTEMRTRNISWE
jgi:hypothetical protein